MSGKGEGIEKRSFLNNGLSDVYRYFFIGTKLTREYVIFLVIP